MHPRSQFLASLTLVALLTACGGSQPGDAGTAPVQLTERSGDSLAQGAALNQTELAAAETTANAADPSLLLDDLPAGQIAARSAYTSGAVARKALAVSIPVYRFYNSSSGAHFFTTNTTERDHVIATLSPPYAYEGPAFSVANIASPGLSPVHRFFNSQSGVHFYTISEAERANVVATLPHFTYEGIAYYASQVAGQSLVPFYRFYVPSRGFHFYTASETEKASILANLGATYRYEGIGYYVLASDWTAPRKNLPHTGLTNQECYQAGSFSQVACGSTGALSLNPQQDGHRTAINPMSYSAVGANPMTSCVKDNVTGLVWEGKEATGTRAGSNIYTNHGDGRAGDASAYVTAVNAMNLCGFSDWRLPTVDELMSTMDFHATTVTALLNPTAFPNSAALRHWTGSRYTGPSADNTFSWVVSFQTGGMFAIARTDLYPVRLVRGAQWVSSTYTITSVSYPGDSSNNAVTDDQTGLTWRRCNEGRTWNGSTCTGTALILSQEQALTQATSRSGWRLPNARELGSLSDRSRSGLAVDTNLFPQEAIIRYGWSTTRGPSSASSAYAMSPDGGYLSTFTRDAVFANARLVKITP